MQTGEPQVIPWPKRLMDLGERRLVRTKRNLTNGHGTIAKGTIGRTQFRPSAWTRMYFQAEKCEYCGYAPSISNVHRDDLELLAE